MAVAYLTFRGALLLLLLLHFQRPGEATEAVRPGPSDGNWQCLSLTVFILMSLLCKRLLSLDLRGTVVVICGMYMIL